MTKPPTWRDRAKSIEQSYMVLADLYAQLSEALGFELSAFGDPLATHEEILKRAKEQK